MHASNLIKPLLLPRARIDAITDTTEALRTQRLDLLGRLREQFTALRAQRDLLAEAQAMLRKSEAGNAASAIAARYGFTPREAEVALLLASGHGNSAIASALKISPHTARHHTQHVLAKLGVHSRAAAGARLRRLT